MNENDGERELVLGNKHLLTIFFVGALLCGVFFAMGYVVGGNSAKSAGAPAAGNTPDGSPEPVTEGKREEPQSPPPADSGSAAPAPADAAPPLPAADSRISDNPAAAGSRRASVPVAAPPVVPVRTPAPARSAQAGATSSTGTGVFISTPEAGASYLQVTATSRPEADRLVITLREGGLPAILAESSKPDLFRVLVGPYRSTLSLSEAKNKLKTDSFGDVIVVKF